MILVLFGQPGCGKTTLSNSLKESYGSIEQIDGDGLRTVFNNTDYSRYGRLRNLNRASDIAVYVNNVQKRNVVLSLVYPYQEARDYLNDMTNDVRWVYLTYDGIRGRENYHVQDFETPKEKVLRINTSLYSIDHCTNVIKNLFIYEKVFS
jgi:GTPase SAR1 family protein